MIHITIGIMFTHKPGIMMKICTYDWTCNIWYRIHTLVWLVDSIYIVKSTKMCLAVPFYFFNLRKDRKNTSFFSRLRFPNSEMQVAARDTSGDVIVVKLVGFQVMEHDWHHVDAWIWHNDQNLYVLMNTKYLVSFIHKAHHGRCRITPMACWSLTKHTNQTLVLVTSRWRQIVTGWQETVWDKGGGATCLHVVFSARSNSFIGSAVASSEKTTLKMIRMISKSGEMFNSQAQEQRHWRNQGVDITITSTDRMRMWNKIGLQQSINAMLRLRS